ncbi:hypothetical protein U8607_10625 [Methylobacterium durans]|uniref:hypothetical protein n=1 Tax=Methylobacterium durans TaxID=2202825 RepID=UPI002AFEE573|nr:hypothetical protein [Methylobacterium durans]MEA1832537.1 hypothetical protein [Methylobacterium durans]
MAVGSNAAHGGLDRVDLAQFTLETFDYTDGADRKWTVGEAATDIADPMTDLLLAKRRNCDPRTVIGGIEPHLKAVTSEAR